MTDSHQHPHGHSQPAHAGEPAERRRLNETQMFDAQQKTGALYEQVAQSNDSNGQLPLQHLRLGSPISLRSPKHVPHGPDEYDESGLAGLDTPGGPVTPARAADVPPLERKSNFGEQADSHGGTVPSASRDGSSDDLGDANDDGTDDDDGGVALTVRDPTRTPERDIGRSAGRRE